MFDDKIAAAEHMRYSDGTKSWLKTTTNYLISKAHEMKDFLPWAESFQSQVITPQHVRALADAGICSDVEPEKLSKDLRGYLNLCPTGSEKVAFDNADPGNGFDAWRRVVVPIGPRSEVQFHRMHKEVHSPSASRRLGDIMNDLDH